MHPAQLYGINLVRDPVPDNYHLGEDPNDPGKPRTRYPYHVRVLVPCYKESLEILRRRAPGPLPAHLACTASIHAARAGYDLIDDGVIMISQYACQYQHDVLKLACTATASSEEMCPCMRRTVMAAYDATLPAGCQRTIYLCDDGKVLHTCS